MARKTLSEEAVQAWIDDRKGWKVADGQIRREFKFKSFRDSVVFVNRVATLADEADHHPDIDIRYTRVTISLSTHDAGGITEKDLQLAKDIDFATSAR